MKIILSESKFNSVVDKFLTKELSDLTPEVSTDSMIRGGERTVLRRNGDAKLIIIRYKDDEVEDQVWINGDLYRDLELLSLDTLDKKTPHLVRWVKNHLGVDVDQVFTFEEGEENYVY